MSTFLRYVRRRINNNKNFLMVISGETGSGKSYAALRLLEKLDSRGFNIDKVVFTAQDFVDAVERARTGEGILFDEIGVGAGRREWYTITNRMINYVSQMFRYRRLVVIHTAPLSEFIDSGLVKLFHAYAETAGIDYERKRCLLKLFRLQYNERLKKLYYHYLMYRNSAGIKKITRIYVKHPSAELAKEYEKKKDKQFKALLKLAKDEIEQHNKKKGKGSGIDYDEIVDKVYMNYESYLAAWRGKTIISYKKIMADFGVSYHPASAVKAKVEYMLQKQGVL